MLRYTDLSHFCFHKRSPSVDLHIPVCVSFFSQSQSQSECSLARLPRHLAIFRLFPFNCHFVICYVWDSIYTFYSTFDYIAKCENEPSVWRQHERKKTCTHLMMVWNVATNDVGKHHHSHQSHQYMTNLNTRTAMNQKIVQFHRQ